MNYKFGFKRIIYVVAIVITVACGVIAVYLPIQWRNDAGDISNDTFEMLNIAAKEGLARDYNMSYGDITQLILKDGKLPDGKSPGREINQTLTRTCESVRNDRFWYRLSKNELIGMVVLCGLCGVVADYVGTWAVLWYGGLAIFVFIHWIVLGFVDKNSKDSTMTRKKIAEYREELRNILNTDAAGRLEKLEDLAKKVGAGFVHTKLLDPVVVEKTDTLTVINKPQNPISELELVQSINNALQTENMIDMCRIANRNFGISIGVVITAFLSALAAWAAR